MNAQNHNIVETDSTNNYLKRLMRKSVLKDYTCVIADFQTAGKGQNINKWESQLGKNALFSIYINPKQISPGNQFIISKIVSLAIVDFLGQHTENISIKWPNDIYVGDRKIAGILIEITIKGSKIENAIVGIGLNLNQTEFSDKLPNPISLKQLNSSNFDIKETIEEIITRIENYFIQISEGGEDEINKLYHSKIFRLNKLCDYFVDSRKIKGKIRGVNEYGQLKMETEEGLLLFSFNEVEYLIGKKE